MKKTFLVITVLMFGFFAWLNSEKATRNSVFPDSNYKSSIYQGEATYQSNCAGCHGSSLSGTEKGPSLLDDVYKSSHHSDLSFYYAVNDGVRQHHWQFGDMPAIKGLSPEGVSDIVAYVRYKQKIAKIIKN
ncbi:Cytochrome c family protein [uncultured Candidatus Thioglobus sp.]|nr:Cytochrome c family protein [uncultured Candidatus Thioglobus sp.]